MSEATERAGGSGPRAGESARSIVYLNVVAVTIWFHNVWRGTANQILDWADNLKHREDSPAKRRACVFKHGRLDQQVRTHVFWFEDFARF